eukprot:8746469-Pyramimonas_sp.AAC.1
MCIRDSRMPHNPHPLANSHGECASVGPDGSLGDSLFSGQGSVAASARRARITVDAAQGNVRVLLRALLRRGHNNVESLEGSTQKAPSMIMAALKDCRMLLLQS